MLRTSFRRSSRTPLPDATPPKPLIGVPRGRILEKSKSIALEPGMKKESKRRPSACTHPSLESGTTNISLFFSSGSRTCIFCFEASVSNPTPTPSMEASIRKQNGSDTFFEGLVLVETKAQLFSAAYTPLSSVNCEPIAHNPRPGGKNLKLKMRSNISSASICFLLSSQPSPLDCSQPFCILKVPSTTRCTVSCQSSFSPSSLTLE
mmetsp:Transcript_30235/g.48468  ORF Transcript_30235/g.48468 Transcript_30235/m.48468 type:complete len:206 (+) Transcript_30235:538-1155(+)